MKLQSHDLYRLRRAALDAELAELQAQLARHRLRELTLRLEAKYQLLTTEACIDIHSGEISQKREMADEHRGHAGQAA